MAAPPRWAPPEWAKHPDREREPRIEVYDNGILTRTINLAQVRSLTVGRQESAVEVFVDDASVSRTHAAFVNSSSATFIVDLKSAQGTFVSDERVVPIPQLGTQVSHPCVMCKPWPCAGCVAWRVHGHLGASPHLASPPPPSPPPPSLPPPATRPAKSGKGGRTATPGSHYAQQQRSRPDLPTWLNWPTD